MRYFGLGPWTALDGGLVLLGAAATVFGARGYNLTRRYERAYRDRLHALLTPETDD